MPTSHPFQLDDIVQLIIETAPLSILDIGVGFGKYGVLTREYLELWNGYKPYEEWTHRIDGIDAFSSYLTPLHDFIYNTVYIGNAINLIPSLETRYDLILLVDVLEHFERDEGFSLLAMAADKGRNMIISTPLDIGIQCDSFTNPYERHRFQWRRRHLRSLENAFFVTNRKSILCFCGEDAPRVKRRFMRRGRSTLFRECLPHLAATHEGVKGFLQRLALRMRGLQ